MYRLNRNIIIYISLFLKLIGYMKHLLTLVVSLLMLCGFSCGSKHEVVDSDALAQYRDTLIGNFSGLEIDTLNRYSYM